MSTSIPEPSPSEPDARRPRRVLAIALAAGLVASFLSWGAGEGVRGWFRPTPSPAAGSNPFAAPYESGELSRTDVKNATLAYGLRGAILGLLLGVAGAAARRSPLAAVLAGLTGLVIGGGIGAGASFAAFTAYFRLVEPSQPQLLSSILAHVGAWAPAGAAAGLALGLGLGGRGRMARAMAGGLLGAAVGAMLYDVAGSIAFPSGRTDEPIATSALARLLGHAAVGLFTALGAALFVEAGSAASLPQGPATP